MHFSIQSLYVVRLCMRQTTLFLFAVFLYLLSVSATPALAATYPSPALDDALLGELSYQTVDAHDTVVTLAQKYDVGYNAIEDANPNVDFTKAFSPNTLLQIPTSHLLPNQPRQGIIINLPEMRMYYFPEHSEQVLTYPIGIGKIGKTIPITKTSITRKIEDPVWIPPADIREFNLKQGVVLPKVMPPGPDNPLGPYAIYMRLPTYLIHSTIFPESVGKRASFGCIRMFESDIQVFFPSIKKGIPVAIINSPVKIGWHQNKLYLEVHQPLAEHGEAYEASLPGMVYLIKKTVGDQSMLIDWQLVAYLAKARDGLPHEIGVMI